MIHRQLISLRLRCPSNLERCAEIYDFIIMFRPIAVKAVFHPKYPYQKRQMLTAACTCRTILFILFRVFIIFHTPENQKLIQLINSMELLQYTYISTTGRSC